MCDMVSIDMNETMLYESAEVFEQIAKAVFSRLEITISRVQKNNGRYVDFVVECPEGNLHIGHMRDRYEKGGVPASSVGMYFLSVDSGPEFRTTDNEVTPSCLGSYGFGIQRCIHAVIEQHRDGLGIAFPQAVRPFDSAVILLDPADQQQRTLAEECYRTLYNNGGKPLFDDRRGKLIKEKTALADFFGIPFKLIIGRREASNKTVTVKWRNGSEEQVYPASDTLLKLLHT